MEKNILLTGQPGIGKTTVIKKIVDQLDPRDAGGFWSEELRVGERRVGFAIETLSGERGILAHIDQPEGPMVGKYRVNISDIDSIIIPELIRARESESVIIIDEIAKMELYSKIFVEEVRMCLNTRRGIGTIQKRPYPILDEIRSREDVDILELTIHNRNQLPSYILGLLNK